VIPGNLLAASEFFPSCHEEFSASKPRFSAFLGQRVRGKMGGNAKAVAATISVIITMGVIMKLHDCLGFLSSPK